MKFNMYMQVASMEMTESVHVLYLLVCQGERFPYAWDHSTQENQILPQFASVNILVSEILTLCMLVCVCMCVRAWSQVQSLPHSGDWV